MLDSGRGLLAAPFVKVVESCYKRYTKGFLQGRTKAFLNIGVSLTTLKAHRPRTVLQDPT